MQGMTTECEHTQLGMSAHLPFLIRTDVRVCASVCSPARLARRLGVLAQVHGESTPEVPQATSLSASGIALPSHGPAVSRCREASCGFFLQTLVVD